MTKKKLSRRQYLITVALLLMALWFEACRGGNLPEKNSEDFRFVFATDIHLMPTKQADEGFNQAIVSINGLNPNPQFVIMGGDLIEDKYTQDLESAEKMFNQYQNISKKLHMPVYNVIGNNDVIGWSKKSRIDPSHPEFGKGMFRKRLGKGATYRSFNYGGWHFILLDSIEKSEDGGLMGYIDDNQVGWLRDDLNTTGEKKPVCVALHIPLVTTFNQIHRNTMLAPPKFAQVNNGTKIIKLLSKYNIKLILQGHLHIVEEIKYKKTTYITGGILSGAKWEAPSYLGHPNGFVVVDVKGDEFNWQYQTYRWTSQKKEVGI